MKFWLHKLEILLRTEEFTTVFNQKIVYKQIAWQVRAGHYENTCQMICLPHS
jgi:hypothetical protein